VGSVCAKSWPDLVRSRLRPVGRASRLPGQKLRIRVRQHSRHRRHACSCISPHPRAHVGKGPARPIPPRAAKVRARRALSESENVRSNVKADVNLAQQNFRSSGRRFPGLNGSWNRHGCPGFLRLSISTGAASPRLDRGKQYVKVKPITPTEKKRRIMRVTGFS